MDVNLPGQDGLTLTRQIKARPATAHILVAALTAYAMTEDQERILAAGCDGYISKPIDVPQFPAQIARYLAGRARPARIARGTMGGATRPPQPLLDHRPSEVGVGRDMVPGTSYPGWSKRKVSP